MLMYAIYNLPPSQRLEQQLRQIWELSDADGDSKLSLAEFCMGMHLIVCVSKKGMAVPAILARSLLSGAAPSSTLASPAQPRGSSPATSLPHSPVMRTSPPMQPQPAALITSNTGTGDAFRCVLKIKPI